MAITDRQAALTAEYLSAHNVAPPVKQERRGRPMLGAPPAEPTMPALPPMPAPRPDDAEPSAQQWVSKPGCFMTLGHLRALAWMAEVSAIHVGHGTRHWAWRQDLIQFHQRNK